MTAFFAKPLVPLKNWLVHTSKHYLAVVHYSEKVYNIHHLNKFNCASLRVLYSLNPQRRFSTIKPEILPVVRSSPLAGMKEFARFH